MQCRNCGASVSSTDKVCTKCGTPMAQPMVSGSSAEERNWIVGAHLSGLLGFIGPLIIWLVKKDESSTISEAAKEALNFQITCAIASFVSSMLVALLIGIPMLGIVWLAWIGFMIMAAVKASNGENYRYPFTLRLIK